MPPVGRQNKWYNDCWAQKHPIAISRWTPHKGSFYNQEKRNNASKLCTRGSKIHLLRLGLRPFPNVPMADFGPLKDCMDKICSLQNYAMLTKAPTRECNVLRTKFNIMAAFFPANPLLAHIFASIAPTCLGQNKVRIEADEYPLASV